MAQVAVRLDDVTLVALSRDHKGSATLMESVVERIGAMSRRHEGNVEGLVNGVWTAYSQRSPVVGVWAAVTSDGALVGHVLTEIREWNGRPVCWITQVEADQPVTQRVRDLVLSTVEEWVEAFNFSAAARGMRVDDLMFETPRSAAAWWRHSGWVEKRVVMCKRTRIGRGQ